MRTHIEGNSIKHPWVMMTSSNGNIFHVTGPLWGEFTGEFPSQRPVMWSFDVFFDVCLNKHLSKTLRCWWFEMPSHPLWLHLDGTNYRPWKKIYSMNTKMLYRYKFHICVNLNIMDFSTWNMLNHQNVDLNFVFRFGRITLILICFRLEMD